MTSPDKLAAALRFVEMAIDKKKLDKAAEAFKQAHGLDLTHTYYEAMRAIGERDGKIS